MKSSIGIIGFGVVGQALNEGFKNESVLFFDKYKDSTRLDEVVKKSEFIFIALPSPMYKDESGIDLSIIDENLELIAPLARGTDKIIIIKSTVPPGTTRAYQEKYPDLKFAFNPEFLTESNFIEDFLNADRTIIAAFDESVTKRVVDLYKKTFPKTTIYTSDPTAAELAKDMANAYLALKVTFANQLYDYSQKLGVDYYEAKRLMVTDSRIKDTHLGITPDRGFGGKCFPKDVVGLVGAASDSQVDLSIIKEAWEYNKRVRKNHDWEKIPFATSENKKD